MNISEPVELNAGETIGVIVNWNNNSKAEHNRTTLSLTLLAEKVEQPQTLQASVLQPGQLPLLSADELMPLQLCRGLRVLELRGEAITHLNFLAGLTELAELTLAGTRAADLGPLAGLPKLKRLHLTGLRLDGPAVPTAPLAALALLEELSLAGSASVEDAVPIGKIPALRKLVLAGSGVANRNPLQQPGLVIE